MNQNLKLLIAENVKNTELGILRIKRNWQINSYSNIETEKYLKEVISTSQLVSVETIGKIIILETRNIMLF